MGRKMADFCRKVGRQINLYVVTEKIKKIECRREEERDRCVYSKLQRRGWKDKENLRVLKKRDQIMTVDKRARRY